MVYHLCSELDLYTAYFFFFQAEDGIRDHCVTGVQTCALPILRGKPYIARLQLGLRKPKDRVLGCDVAGQVEALGKDVTMFRPGDDVFGSPFMHGLGAFAEYVCVP